MPLVPIQSMVKHAVDEKYAIGYFESWSIDSLQGVIDAAQETRSLVIIVVNGEFMSRPERVAQEQLSWYGALGKAAAKSATVPCGLIFNECIQIDWVLQSIDYGFNLVKPTDESGDLAR